MIAINFNWSSDIWMYQNLFKVYIKSLTATSHFCLFHCFACHESAGSVFSKRKTCAWSLAEAYCLRRISSTSGCVICKQHFLTKLCLLFYTDGSTKDTIFEPLVIGHDVKRYLRNGPQQSGINKSLLRETDQCPVP